MIYQKNNIARFIDFAVLCCELYDFVRVWTRCPCYLQKLSVISFGELATVFLVIVILSLVINESLYKLY